MLRRVVGILAVIIGAAVFVYFSWAAHRIGAHAIMEPEWPRAFPYPDSWLLALNNYYDAKYPAIAPHIKMHGELARVLRDVTLASFAGAVAFIAGLVLLLFPVILQRIRSRCHGFEVIASSDDATAGEA